ncbi:uncharacterized protein MYCFIDRAFT_169723 [Pseudocercospora fijiensis CIRAD86]|uniref:Uncharacterized protein n=1 Tax=Pseudocercospora fijiensis (strain CIRAD86) TaxID=383855 RepID=N1Q6I3_PSEFD|nr:uncharacterized protein MYCFIDRAFT_169723 [Pseudocercospora fijiensis CIRAD86]EME88005.1 hypothetical protein MYCFIDRAFT_169723 [Pseudocercospora fijiensis CIRAD86]
MGGLIPRAQARGEGWLTVARIAILESSVPELLLLISSDSRMLTNKQCHGNGQPPRPWHCEVHNNNSLAGCKHDQHSTWAVHTKQLADRRVRVVGLYSSDTACAFCPRHHIALRMSATFLCNIRFVYSYSYSYSGNDSNSNSYSCLKSWPWIMSVNYDFIQGAVLLSSPPSPSPSPSPPSCLCINAWSCRIEPRNNECMPGTCSTRDGMITPGASVTPGILTLSSESAVNISLNIISKHITLMRIAIGAQAAARQDYHARPTYSFASISLGSVICGHATLMPYWRSCPYQSDTALVVGPPRPLPLIREVLERSTPNSPKTIRSPSTLIMLPGSGIIYLHQLQDLITGVGTPVIQHLWKMQLTSVHGASDSLLHIHGGPGLRTIHICHGPIHISSICSLPVAWNMALHSICRVLIYHIPLGLEIGLSSQDHESADLPQILAAESLTPSQQADSSCCGINHGRRHDVARSPEGRAGEIAHSSLITDRNSPASPAKISLRPKSVDNPKGEQLRPSFMLPEGHLDSAHAAGRLRVVEMRAIRASIEIATRNKHLVRLECRCGLAQSPSTRGSLVPYNMNVCKKLSTSFSKCVLISLPRRAYSSAKTNPIRSRLRISQHYWVSRVT